MIFIDATTNISVWWLLLLTLIGYRTIGHHATHHPHHLIHWYTQYLSQTALFNLSFQSFTIVFISLKVPLLVEYEKYMYSLVIARKSFSKHHFVLVKLWKGRVFYTKIKRERFLRKSVYSLRVLSEILILIGSAIFDATFNLVTRVGLP